MPKFVNWKRRACVAAALAALAVSSPGFARDAAPAPISRTVIASMDAAIQEMMTQHKAAGYAVAIARGDRIVFQKGYGLADIENGVAITPDTVFRVGSVTKQFTAVGILALVDQGKLSVNDRLSKYLPDYPNADKITIYQMITHTSGLANYTGQELYRRTSRLEGTTMEMVDALVTVKPQFEFEPGTAWSYSNTGFYLAGAVIEKITGEKFADYMRTRIFEPAGLKHTAIDDGGDIIAHRAHGYASSPDSAAGYRNAAPTSMTVAGGAGAARSTIGDLVAWNAALLGGKILKPETLAMMTAPAKLSDGRPASAGWVAKHQPVPTADYGMGIGLGDDKGRPMIGHGGAISGFNAALFTYPDRNVTIVVLANTGGATYRFAPRIADIVLADAKSGLPAKAQ